MRVISEPELVAQCKAGDHAAFTELIRRNSPVATYAIRSIVQNRTDAEDIMQDTLLKAYRGVSCFDGRSKFSTWLTRIAINNALMYFRRRKNRVEVSLDWEANEGEGQTFQLADSREDPELALIRDQAVFMIRKAVNKLPTNLRRYTSKRYLEELSHEQVAASLGISLAAGKSRSLRARQKLESSLGCVLSRPG